MARVSKRLLEGSHGAGLSGSSWVLPDDAAREFPLDDEDRGVTAAARA